MYQGFTLVELAIVMVIIGLLIGGILKGQELLQSADIRAIISQVNGIGAASSTFFDKYGSIPGDINDATLKIRGCSAPCGNGNGDGNVGNLLDTNSLGRVQAGITAMPDVETSYFWKHLALADLIKEVDANAPITLPEFGVTHPKVSLGGGFEVATFSRSSGDWTTGLSLRYQNSLASQPYPQMAVITGRVAQEIDSKMDDGVPDIGRVAGDFLSSGCDNNGQYSMNDAESCIMYFSIRQ